MKYLAEVLTAVAFVAFAMGTLLVPEGSPAWGFCFFFAGWFLNQFINLFKVRKIHRTYEHLMDFKELEEEFMKKMFEQDGEVQEISEDGNGAPNLVADKKNRN